MKRRCCLVQKLRYRYFYITAAILDFRLPVTSDDIRNSAVEFLDPENGGVAVGILFLSVIGAEIRWGLFYPLGHIKL